MYNYCRPEGKSSRTTRKISEKYVATKENEDNNSWKKPEEGWVKCNVDASFIKEDRTGSWGAVITDHN
jgi:hypothetical protein